jgi:predicted DNA-binding protein (MmcQ/YjbR family)
MYLEEIREYCLSKAGVAECLPFDNETLVFKVLDKMFLLTNINNPVSVNLKCDPEKAIALREEYDAIKPGYHMNKQHWNTVLLDGTINQDLLIELINHSYNIVVAKLPKKLQVELKNFI